MKLSPLSCHSHPVVSTPKTKKTGPEPQFFVVAGTVVVVYRANYCAVGTGKSVPGEQLGIAVATHFTQEFVRDPEPIVKSVRPMRLAPTVVGSGCVLV